jgi:hypothetical protein
LDDRCEKLGEAVLDVVGEGALHGDAPAVLNVDEQLADRRAVKDLIVGGAQIESFLRIKQ